MGEATPSWARCSAREHSRTGRACMHSQSKDRSGRTETQIRADDSGGAFEHPRPHCAVQSCGPTLGCASDSSSPMVRLARHPRHCCLFVLFYSLLCCGRCARAQDAAKRAAALLLLHSGYSSTQRRTLIHRTSSTTRLIPALQPPLCPSTTVTHPPIQRWSDSTAVHFPHSSEPSAAPPPCLCITPSSAATCTTHGSSRSSRQRSPIRPPPLWPTARPPLTARADPQVATAAHVHTTQTPFRYSCNNSR